MVIDVELPWIWKYRVILNYCQCFRGIRMGADKSLAFHISYFPFCSTTKIIFLVWVKEVRTAKSEVCVD
jgi:hypothetical protein